MVKRVIYPPMWLAFGLVAVFALNQFMPGPRFTSAASQGVGGVVIVADALIEAQRATIALAAEISGAVGASPVTEATARADGTPRSSLFSRRAASPPGTARRRATWSGLCSAGSSGTNVKD